LPGVGLPSKKAKLKPIPIVVLINSHNKPTASELIILARNFLISVSSLFNSIKINVFLTII